MFTSKSLKSLKLSFKDLSAFKLHPETMKLIESQGKEIEYFELRCLAINSIDMMTSLTKLKSLKLNENFWPDDVRIEVISLAKNCPKLDTIEFDDLFFNDETSMLLALDTLFYEKRLTLKSLCFKEVKASNGFTDDFLRNLSLCQNLEEFQCQKTDLTQSSLDIIVRLPKLKKLTFHHIRMSSDTVRKFLRKLNKTNLECLIISNCSGFDDTAFQNLSELSFPKLQRLFIYRDCPTLGPEIENLIRQIIQNCPYLKSIQFFYNMSFIPGKENVKSQAQMVFKIIKESNVFICWQNELNWSFPSMNCKAMQTATEKCLKIEDLSVFEKYMKMKNDFLKWCNVNDNIDFNIAAKINFKSHYIDSM